MESYLKKFMRELLEHKNNLNEYVDELYADDTREDDLNALFGALKKEGLLSCIYADNRAYEVQLTLNGKNLPASEQKNYVSEIYNQFTDEEISRKIAKLIIPQDIDIDIRIVFQSLKGLHTACPEHTGDWYFSGRYPTPGGVRMLGKAYIAYYRAEKTNGGHA